MLPSETMIWQPEFTDKTLSRKPGAVHSKDFAVSMNGVKVEQEGARNLGEIKLGVNGNLNPAASVWGNVGVQLGDNGYNDTAVMVGLKYKF
ncbi:autotransporter outer membrane beta-barrel domain-containing protein [Escherichia coli]|nr:autotransporter outer membrane beta-barrel domain-containing protein [Escherichia coli]NGI72186.1 autotransporter outer membrane beta-barrel domain-containing protein [Escherichia coli]